MSILVRGVPIYTDMYQYMLYQDVAYRDIVYWYMGVHPGTSRTNMHGHVPVHDVLVYVGVY